MYNLTLDITIRYTIHSFLFLVARAHGLLIELCVYFVFKNVVQIVAYFLSSHAECFHFCLYQYYLFVLVIWPACFFSSSILNVCYVLCFILPAFVPCVPNFVDIPSLTDYYHYYYYFSLQILVKN